MADLLLVEDDDLIAEVMAEILGEEHQVRVATNGEEGLARIRERVPDAIVLDVEMPVLDGPGMAWRLFLQDAGAERIPIVLVSGVADLHRVARQVGTPYWLAKPVQVDELLSMIRRALKERIPPSPQPQPSPGAG